ncbi:C2 domain-containing At1g53590 isoform X2 [Olea europaea subsp. europaea]|uniref:C2 domain-containing At1g53590 isoform X2 n=1 Tax=Olea europaea subsp. europaea TaxID=158383 RepID=A0A8S0RFZ3_OLEEU|nr:C2 domain-containing At1g53590 isoform X2 [Olea europaea subsp. europaea]
MLGNWFSIDAKDPIAYAIVEILEGANMKSSDLNGLADPYVKGQLGPYRFWTKTQKKNLSPKWYEEFKISICTWESPNVLIIEVHDKDHLFDDLLVNCSVNINDVKDIQRHDMWLSLENIKMGRLHLAVTMSEGDTKCAENVCNIESIDKVLKENSVTDDASQRGSCYRLSEKSPKVVDKFEPIDIEGQRKTGIWIQQPGSEVAQVWEPQKEKSRHLETHHLDGQVQAEGGDPAGSQASTASSTDESMDNVTLGVTDLVIPSLVVYSAASRFGNDSIKIEDNVNQTDTLSGTNSFKSKDDIVQTRNEPTINSMEQKTKVIPKRNEPILNSIQMKTKAIAKDSETINR